LRRRLKEKLSAHLPSRALSQIYGSFDVIGDIAIFKIPKNGKRSVETVANQIMATQKHVKTVFVQTSGVAGDFRVRKLRLVAGEDKTTAKYKESGCIFAVDVESCYFSPRLSYERLRIAGLVKPAETVVNMFAGVGCFSIIIAKMVNTAKVYSIDANPAAFRYMEENVKLNRVYGKVFPLIGDSKNIVNDQLQGKADRVLMPLPELVLEYLPYAVSALKCGCGWIHLYDFQHASGRENPVEKTRQKVAQRLDGLGVQYFFAFSRVVRSIGPNWYQTVLDIRVG
jgi:tRNA (guanine37-N1)-methyltransferase